MEDKRDYRKLWSDALAMIRERVGEHVYNVWFRDITAERYDDAQRQLLLSVPCNYVYEYLEERHVQLLSEVLGKTFGPGVRLGYRIAPQQPAAAQPIEIQRREAFGDYPGRPHIAVPDAEERLRKGLDYFLGEGRAQWLPAYDKVVRWLTDNKGKGLLCCGTSGLGKTLICQKILPVIFGAGVKSVTAKEMATRIDDLLTERIVIVDDIGKEDSEVWLNYKRRRPFFELCDAAERTGMLLIITTNLSTTPVNDPRYPQSIQSCYGHEVLSRLRSLTSHVIFEGEDLRK